MACRKSSQSSSAILHSNIRDLGIVNDNDTGVAACFATAAMAGVRKVGGLGFTTAVRIDSCRELWQKLCLNQSENTPETSSGASPQTGHNSRTAFALLYVW